MSWYQIKAKGEKAAEVLIFGDIGENWWGESVTAKAFISELNALDADTINIRINSYGGAVSDGLAIYNAIKRHKAKTDTFVEGVAVSIASLIAMAGDTVHMAENAMLMIHAPWGGAVGNAHDMRDMADMLDKYAEAMASSYMQKSGKSRDDVLALLQDGKDHWYTAAEAKAEGFVDEITNAIAAAASLAGGKAFDLSRFLTNRPAAAVAQPSNQTGEKPMPTQTPAATDPNAANNNAAVAAAPTREEVLASEKARRAAIRAAVPPNVLAMEGMQAILDAALEDENTTVADFHAKVLAQMGKGASVANPPGYAPRIEHGQAAEDKFAMAASQAIMVRCGLEKRDPQNEWTGRKLSELARASLEMRGISCRGKLPIEVAAMALTRRPLAAGQTTSDFDVILENVLHKTLISGWQNTPDIWSRVCKIGSVGDLRAWNRINPGTIGDIDEVGENGEYLFKQIPDGVKESVQAKRRGNRIAVTPEVIINDDLSYFSDVPRSFGRAAKRSIESAFITLLVSNPVMKEDNKALFHADHGNYVTAGAAPSVTTIDAGRQAMAGQKDVSGNEVLDIVPAIFLSPLSLGSTARVVNNSAYDPDAANKLQRVNPVAGLFKDVIDTARLTGAGWYMFADPEVMPTFEVVFLDGQTEPLLTQDTDFATSGLQWKVELPFGVGAIGWRGAYYNDGTP